MGWGGVVVVVNVLSQNTAEWFKVWTPNKKKATAYLGHDSYFLFILQLAQKRRRIFHLQQSAAEC